MLKTVDIKTGTVKSMSNQKTFLMRARQVIEIIVCRAIENSARGELSDLSVVSSLYLMKLCYEVDVDTIVDRKSLGNVIYLTFYDRSQVLYHSGKKQIANLSQIIDFDFNLLIRFIFERYLTS